MYIEFVIEFPTNHKSPKQWIQDMESQSRCKKRYPLEFTNEIFTRQSWGSKPRLSDLWYMNLLER